MLKHGSESAHDYNVSCLCSPSMNRWSTYVTGIYGNSSTANLKKAFADIVINEYAARYTTKIDGWWFDHASFGDIPLLTTTVRKYNNATVIAFNEGQKSPLINNNPGYEDYTFGHPNRIDRYPSSSLINLPMLTAIEGTVTSARPGYLAASGGELSLGHMYIPMCEDWNPIGSKLVWNVTQAVDWMGRAIRAKGSWTWNIPRETNGFPGLSFLNYTDVAFLKQVLASLPAVSSAPTPIPPATTTPLSNGPTTAPAITSGPKQSECMGVYSVLFRHTIQFN